MVFWDEIAGAGVARLPGRDLGQGAGRRDDHAHGAASRRRIDTVVATNLHADILSDLAGGAGRFARHRADRQHRSGAAQSRRCSSRSTARRSTSPARASPTRSARFWTAAMMLEHLGEKAAAATLMRAVERVTADRHCIRPTSAARRRRRKVTDAVIERDPSLQCLSGSVTSEGWTDARARAAAAAPCSTRRSAAPIRGGAVAAHLPEKPTGRCIVVGAASRPR